MNLTTTKRTFLLTLEEEEAAVIKGLLGGCCSFNGDVIQSLFDLFEDNSVTTRGHYESPAPRFNEGRDDDIPF